MSRTKSSNSSLGHTAVPLELKNSSEINFYSHILSYPLGMDHAQKTVLLLRSADHTGNTCHVSDCEFIGPLPVLGMAQMT
jgi:hypothetical protein